MLVHISPGGGGLEFPLWGGERGHLLWRGQEGWGAHPTWNNGEVAIWNIWRDSYVWHEEVETLCPLLFSSHPNLTPGRLGVWG